MAEFQFRGMAKGQNITDIVIDNVNDLATARTLAEARYPGYKLSNGMKLGVQTPPAPNTPLSPPNQLGGIQTPVSSSSSSVSYTPSAASSDSSLGWFVLGVTFTATVVVIKFICKSTWKVMKFTYNRALKPGCIKANSYVRSHWSF